MSLNNFEIYNPSSSQEVRRIIRIKGVEFDENFLAGIIGDYFNRNYLESAPRLSDALEIYLKESVASDERKFRGDALHVFNRFKSLLGDLYISEIRYVHACTFRDYLISLGLKPETVKKQTAFLSAMLSAAFRYFDIEKTSPFRALKISGLGFKKPMRLITKDLLLEVKQRLLTNVTPYKLVGLLQLNTGLRLSEPVYAQLNDCVLDHSIPHIWIRRNELSKRKTKSSIRAVPLVGVSLLAAKKLVELAKSQDSNWLVPQYAHYHGSNSCSAIMNKYLRDLEFRSHMFRHSLIDRMKACNDIPTRLAESITGHSSGGSEFNNYGTVGYTLEQKLDVLKRIDV